MNDINKIIYDLRNDNSSWKDISKEVKLPIPTCVYKYKQYGLEHSLPVKNKPKSNKLSDEDKYKIGKAVKGMMDKRGISLYTLNQSVKYYKEKQASDG